MQIENRTRKRRGNIFAEENDEEIINEPQIRFPTKPQRSKFVLTEYHENPFKSDKVFLPATHTDQVKEEYSSVLKSFGHSNFRQPQGKIINDLLVDQKDCMVFLSTGSGKSLLYQFPPMLLKKRREKGCTVVLSPLRSLIDDQMKKARGNGIPVCELRQFNQPFREVLLKNQNYRAALTTSRIFFLSIDIAFSIQMREQIQFIHEYNRIIFFALDEIHCFYGWGMTIRPNIQLAHRVRQFNPSIPICALTATILPSHVNHLQERLQLVNPRIYTSSVDRPNLFYIHQPRSGDLLKDIQLLQTKIGLKLSERRECLYSRLPNGERAWKLQWFMKIIIFFSSKNECKRAYDEIVRNSVIPSAAIYHADLTLKERRIADQNFANGTVKVLCCTSAYGMGVHQPGVRLVLFNSAPRNCTDFFQMSGRAGRETLRSYSAILFKPNDIDRYRSDANTANDQNKVRSMYVDRCRVAYYIGRDACARSFINQTFLGDHDSIRFHTRMCCEYCAKNSKHNELRSGIYTPVLETTVDYKEELILMLSYIASAENGNPVHERKIVDEFTMKDKKERLLKTVNYARRHNNEFWLCFLSMLVTKGFVIVSSVQTKIYLRLSKKGQENLKMPCFKTTKLIYDSRKIDCDIVPIKQFVFNGVREVISRPTISSLLTGPIVDCQNDLPKVVPWKKLRALYDILFKKRAQMHDGVSRVSDELLTVLCHLRPTKTANCSRIPGVPLTIIGVVAVFVPTIKQACIQLKIDDVDCFEDEGIPLKFPEIPNFAQAPLSAYEKNALSLMACNENMNLVANKIHISTIELAVVAGNILLKGLGHCIPSARFGLREVHFDQCISKLGIGDNLRLEDLESGFLRVPQPFPKEKALILFALIKLLNKKSSE